MSQILVSGGFGFIGRHLISALLERHAGVGVLVRPHRADEVETLWPGRSIALRIADLQQRETLPGVCDGFDTIFHLAGYAHSDDVDEQQASALHWQVTVEGTRALLSEASRAGVKRFVFASTVKAMGEGGEEQIDEASAHEPTSGYGRAKHEAERLVLAAARETGMQAAVLRFPLVYGRGNKGNIPRMIAAVDRGLFPPLPVVPNRRSMVHVDDAVQALLLAAENPVANGNIYIVTDGRAYSTREIYVAICEALGRPPPRWQVPLWVLRGAARLGDVLGHMTGRRMPIDRAALGKLLGSAWYSSDRIRRDLGFVSRRTLFDALPEMVKDYRERSQERAACAA